MSTLVATNALEMRGITKAFPGVVASNHVDFTVRAGEIHALVGENGAGKTTLMNVLYGLVHADSGEILIDGKAARISGPRARTPDVPVASRRAMERLWAVVPAVILALVIVWAWRTMHSSTPLAP